MTRIDVRSCDRCFEKGEWETHLDKDSNKVIIYCIPCHSQIHPESQIPFSYKGRKSLEARNKALALV